MPFRRRSRLDRRIGASPAREEHDRLVGRRGVLGQEEIRPHPLVAVARVEGYGLLARAAHLADDLIRAERLHGDAYSKRCDSGVSMNGRL